MDMLDDDEYCEGACSKVVVEKFPPCPLQCMTKPCDAWKRRDPPDLSNLVIVWVYGGPSTGKTTVSNTICSKYGFERIHAGDKLKVEIAMGSPRANCLRNIMKRGELVPNDIVLDLLAREVNLKTKAGAKGFVIDGFPREERQGRMFESMITRCNIMFYLFMEKKAMEENHFARVKTIGKADPKVDPCIASELQIHIFYEHNKRIVDQYPHKIIQIDVNKTDAAKTMDIVSMRLDKVVQLKNAEIQEKKVKEAYYQELGITRRTKEWYDKMKKKQK